MEHLPLTRDQAVERLCRSAFWHREPGPVGVEAEFFVIDDNDQQRVPDPAELRAALTGAPLPGGSALSFEPGGQLELSAPPAAGPLPAIAALAADVRTVGKLLGVRGLRLRGGGAEATRQPRRLVRSARYDAMASYFSDHGCMEAGRTMMTATASVQLNIEAGRDEREVLARWQLAHLLGPVLAAAFAASPVLSGGATGAASGRLQAWSAIDPGRTAPVDLCATAGPGTPRRSPREQWAAYALAAGVLLVPGLGRPPTECTLAQWLEEPSLGGRPATAADVDHHVTTLFPPVRPRGFLELRYLDGQHVSLWPVAVAVTAVLHDDRQAAAVAAEACPPAARRWGEAARCGLADAPLATAARDCLAAARAALSRLDAPASLQAAVEDFATRYTDRGRCPADDTDSGVPVIAAPDTPVLR